MKVGYRDRNSVLSAQIFAEQIINGGSHPEKEFRKGPPLSFGLILKYTWRETLQILAEINYQGSYRAGR